MPRPLRHPEIGRFRASCGKAFELSTHRLRTRVHHAWSSKIFRLRFLLALWWRLSARMARARAPWSSCWQRCTNHHRVPSSWMKLRWRACPPVNGETALLGHSRTSSDSSFACNTLSVWGMCPGWKTNARSLRRSIALAPQTLSRVYGPALLLNLAQHGLAESTYRLGSGRNWRWRAVL